jgi:hypothetical protein
MTPIAYLPINYVQLSVFWTMTGYSPDATQKKIKRGEWREGEHYRHAPDGKILIDLKGYHSWAESQAPAA